jgi:hypothetical protein
MLSSLQQAGHKIVPRDEQFKFVNKPAMVTTQDNAIIGCYLPGLLIKDLDVCAHLEASHFNTYQFLERWFEHGRHPKR